MRRCLLLALAGCLAWANSAAAQTLLNSASRVRSPEPALIVEAVVPEAVGAPLSLNEAPSILDGHGACCPPPCGPHIWGSAEHLFWWVRGKPVPPLAIISDGGPLGTPGAVSLFDDTISYPATHGGRATLGGWFGSAQKYGFEASGFYFENNFRTLTAVEPPGTQFLLIPLLNNGVENTKVVDEFRATSSLQMWGGDANFLVNVIRRPRMSVDLLAGFRYFHLEEDLRLENSFSFFLGTDTQSDRFAAENRFFGGQLGAKASFQFNRASLELIGKVGIGQNHRIVTNSGSSTTFFGAQFDTGLFVREANVGRFSDDQFAVLPEVQIKLGYDLTNNIRLTGGYNFMLLTDVARAGASIDRELGAPGRPSVQFGNQSFWAHGVSGGIEFRW